MDPLLRALRARYSDDDIGAALCGASGEEARRVALWRWETGIERPGLDALRSIAEDLRCELIISQRADTVREPTC